MFKIDPVTNPPNANVPRLFAAFLIAFACFYGTNSGFDINIIGKFSGVISSRACIIIGLI